MSTFVMNSSLTLDVVMQAPARPDEDRRGDCEHGGWAPPYNRPAEPRPDEAIS